MTWESRGHTGWLAKMSLLLAAVAALGWSPIILPQQPAAGQSRLLRANGPEMMPIGVPKVAYRVPGATSADWVDIYNRLYRERIIFLGQEIDDEICNQIIAVMLFSDSEDQSKPLYMYINSPGGSVIAGLALYDTIQHIGSQVITCNIGMAASMVRAHPCRLRRRPARAAPAALDAPSPSVP